MLLDAGTALPLAGVARTVAVVGPCADDPRTFMGCYAFPNHVLPRYPERGPGDLDRLAARCLAQRASGVEVSYAQGLRRDRGRSIRVRRGCRCGPATRTCASPSSVICPGCSGTGPRGRAVMRRTCGCPGCRGSCSTRCSTPARRSSSWSCRGGLMRWGCSRIGLPAWCRRSSLARRVGRRSPAC